MLRLSRPLNATYEYDLIPLIDMLFILLIFFVIAAAFAVRGLEVDLPAANSSKTLSGRVIELRLTADGDILCEGQPLLRQEVRSKLHELVRGFRSRPGRLVLAADPKAPVESLIFLVDEVRMQGGEKLLIATNGQPAADKP